MQITSNLSDLVDRSRYFHSQFAYAGAVALTRAVNEAKRALPAEVQSVFDRPTNFTTEGFYTVGARKDTLQATLGVKDRQAQYLSYQVEGGTRTPKRKALRLPSVVGLDGHGNLPKGLIAQLISRAKAGRHATRAQSTRFGVSQRVDLMYGDPGDGRPPGIYKRVPVGTGRERLVPVVVFPQQPAHYRRKFDFHGAVDRKVRAVFPAELERSWAQALASAR